MLKRWNQIRAIIVMLFAFGISDVFAKADLYMAFDVSGASVQGVFGDNYGNSLHNPEGAFLEPKNGNEKLSPMQWALRLFLKQAHLIDRDNRAPIYGISDAQGCKDGTCFNMLDRERGDNFEEIYRQNMSKIIESRSYGSDFNPLPFMKHMMKKVEESETPEVTLAVIFSSGEIERTEKENFQKQIVESSYQLPIKWLFVVVGKSENRKAIENALEEAEESQIFKNATVLYMDKLFDFDGMRTSKFDIHDSMKDSKVEKLHEKIKDFLDEDQEKVDHAVDMLKSRKERSETMYDAKEKESAEG